MYDCFMLKAPLILHEKKPRVFVYILTCQIKDCDTH